LKRRFFEFVLIPVLFLLAVGILSFIFLLPRFLEKNVLPSLGKQIFTSVNGQIFNIGINKASMGNLTLGDGEKIALRIGSIQADYSLSSIKNKKIDQVKINGFSVNLEISEGKIVIPGLDLEKIAGTEKRHEKLTHSSAVKIDWQLDNFQIANGVINILYEKQHVFIPFDLQIIRNKQPVTASLSIYSLSLHIYPQGEEIAVTGTIDLKSNKGMFSLLADSFDIKSLAFLLGDRQNKLDVGKIAIRSNAEVKLMPFQLVSSGIDCELESLDLNSGLLTFGTPAGSAESGKPLQLKINGNGLQWDVTVHGSMVKPLEASITLDGKFLLENNSAKGAGNIEMGIASQAVALNPGYFPWVIKGNSLINGDFSVERTPIAWHANIISRDSNKDIEFLYGKNMLSTGNPSFSIEGKGDTETTEIEILLAIKNIHATGADTSDIILPRADLQAFFNQEKSPQASLVKGKFELLMSGATIKKELLTVNGDITLAGNMMEQPLQNMKFPGIAGEIIVSNARANEQKNNVTAQSLEGRIPWQLFMENHEANGKMKITGITWKKNELGSFEAGIRLNGDEYSFDGRFIHSLPDGLVTSVTGKAGIADSKYLADMALHMDVTPFNALHLGRFDTSMSNSYINGELGLDSEIRYDTNSLTGNMTVVLKNGRFKNQEKKQTVNDINLSLHIPSLPDIRSAPAQKILFDKASVGDLIFEKGKVIWQLESPDSIFIEEGVVQWVGGRVFTNAVRISPEIDELVVPIFCDRLILTEVLTQFGITGAAGEGTVSGRIPLHISKGNIRFEDGFLYSSPGQGGSVKIAAFDLLSAGIPKNSPQFAQVDFAAEALKNFQYNWVRLLLNSDGEDMVMQMQMDGKPVQSLPFTYDSRTGLLQRADETKKGINQPIRLDVNFRLPLNRFLGYSGKIQDIMKKLQ